MSGTLRGWFQAIAELGVADAPRARVPFYRATNLTVAVTGTAATFGGVGELANQPLRAVAPILLGVLCGLGLVLGHAGYRNAQRLLVVWGLSAALTVSQFLSGSDLFTVGAVLVLVLPFVLFHPDERWGLGAGVLACVPPLAVSVMGVDRPYLSLDPGATLFTRATVTGLCAIILGVVLWWVAHARARAVAEAAARTTEALRAAEAQAQFLAHMSHELRTPLGAILGWATLGRDPERTREAIEIIHRNGDHLLAIVNDILDFSKLRGGELIVERTPISVSEIVAGVDSVMRVAAARAGIELRVSWSSPVPERVSTDGVRVRQILLNLVSNAIKFTRSGNVRLVVGYAAQRRRLSFEVQDDGEGIAPGDRETIFKPFKQGSRTSQEVRTGTGLGLAISRQLANALGGTLAVTSEQGVGSTFTLALSFGPGEVEDRMVRGDEPRDRERSSRRAEAIDLSRRRVLVVEDYEDNALLIQNHLQQHDATVDVAGDGVEGLEMVRRASQEGSGYDLVLMDMQMPRMDGLTATRTLRGDGFDLPIIALTAHVMRGERERCLAAGCNDYLAKPIDVPGLLRTIALQLGIPTSELDDKAAKKARRMAKLRQRFRAQLPEKIDAIANAYESGDAELGKRLAHGLAGAAGGYGLPEVTDAARAVETRSGEEEATVAELRRVVAEALERS